MRNTMPDLPPTSEIARLARSPSALLNHLSNMSPEADEEPDGSFQPPALASQNGNAPRRTPRRRAQPARQPTWHGRPPQEPAPGTTPASPPRPTPIHVERPPRAPQPSGVVVPGDPTLN